MTTETTEPDTQLTLNRDEQEALANSSLLIRFIAEASVALPPGLAKTIEESRLASSSGNWTPAAAEVFWQAYSRLNELAKPATVDTIKASLPLYKRKRWLGLFGAAHPISLSRRTAENYIVILVVTSLCILGLELYAWGVNQQSIQLGPLETSGTALSSSVTKELSQLSTITLPAGQWPIADMSLATQVGTDADNLNDDARLGIIQATTLRRWAFDRDAGTGVLPAARRCSGQTGNQDNSDQWWCKGDSALRAWSVTADSILVAQKRAEIFYGILNGYLLPVMFGLAGSVVFVIRKISEQIKENTFSSASPLRHLLRVWLGPLMGLVVGLFASVIQLQNIGPFALAFLAGYAVEGVFALFDGLVRAMSGASGADSRADVGSSAGRQASAAAG